MLKNRTTNEKRVFFLFFWVVAGFLYYHIRIQGGFMPDLLNNLFYPDATAETIDEDNVIYPYFEEQNNLQQKRDTEKQHVADDEQIILAAQATGNNEIKLTKLTAQTSELKQELSDLNQSLVTVTSGLIDKSIGTTDEARLLSQISQLAAKSGLIIAASNPVDSFENSNLYNALTRTISTIKSGQKAVFGSPVISENQSQILLESDMLTCRQYKIHGNPVLFYLFLQQISQLENSVFVLDIEINNLPNTLNSDSSKNIDVMLVY